MNNIIRIFPTKTSHTPNDEYVFFGEPGLFIPNHKQIHISVTFSWDIQYAKHLQKAWSKVTDMPVKIGGPAVGSETYTFTPGMYLKKGIVVTSRGCNNHCGHCLVSKKEGKLKELKIENGNIILDNNILQCSESHLDEVFEMLKSKSQIEFKGGLQSSLITDNICRKLSVLRIKKLFIAYDKRPDKKYFLNAINILKNYFPPKKIGCYVLVGYKNDTIDKAEKRCQFVYDNGAYPFAMYYQPITSVQRTIPNIEWRKFLHKWCRPAAYVSQSNHK